MKKKKKSYTWTNVLLGFLTLSVFVLCAYGSFLFVVHDSSFFSKLFVSYGTYDSVDNPDEIHAQVVKYILGQSETLPSEFTEKETNHYRDVRQLIKFVGIIVVVASLFLIIALAHIRKTPGLIRTLRNCLIISTGAFMTIAFIISFYFASLFRWLHPFFFDAESYKFNRVEHVTALIYPEPMFASISFRLFLIMLVLLFCVLLLISLDLRVRFRNSGQKSL